MAERTGESVVRRPNGFERFLKRLFLWVVLLGVAYGAGWLSQYSARQLADARAADARLRVPLLEARGDLLQARLELQATNFGEARRHLQGARRAIEQAAKETGDAAARGRLEEALTRTADAQSKAAQLDQTAGASTASAGSAIDAVLATMPPTSAPQ